MRKIRYSAVAAAGLLALALAFPAYGKDKEEREPVGQISLKISSDIEAGEDGDVDVEVLSGSCSVSSVDVDNPKGYWVGGDKPKVKVELSADDGYYFDQSGKGAFDLDGAKYSGSSRDSDKEIMKLTLTLDKLEDGDLNVDGLRWDEENAIAHWDDSPEAGEYKVRLYRGDSSVGSVITTKATSWEFADKLDRPGTYTFKVRIIDRGNNGGDWEESAQLYVTKEDMERFVGGWRQDERGWWFCNADQTYPVNCWKNLGQFWYFFGEDGYMKTGWVQWEGKSYYCDIVSGAMLTNTVTPDGFHVGADGARVE